MVADPTTVRCPLPMLSTTYSPGDATLLPCYVQPKLDGVRMMVDVSGPCGAYSRNAKPLAPPPGVLRLKAPFPCFLDGELYHHGTPFQEILSLVRCPPEDRPVRLQYHVFDLYLPDHPSKPFSERYELLRGVVKEAGLEEDVRLVPNRWVRSPEEVEAALRGFLAEGFEGLVLRPAGSAYEPGARSAGLQKHKPSQDAEYVVVGFSEAEGKDRGTPVFWCETEAGARFRVRPAGSAGDRRALFARARGLVGRLLTVRHAGLLASKPRFPVGLGFRDDVAAATLVSWNLNGVASAARSGALGRVPLADVVCLQELRCSSDAAASGLLQAAFPGYHVHCFVSQERRGHSGVAVVSRERPAAVRRGLDEGDRDGRVLTAEFRGLTVVCVYSPNSGTSLQNLDYRTREWEPRFRRFLRGIAGPLVVCGDLNVAPGPLDVHHPERHERSAGYTARERRAFRRLTEETGLVDCFRHLYPNRVAYTYWSNFARARERGLGWRLDHFLADPRLVRARAAAVLSDVPGSDHAPVVLVLSHVEEEPPQEGGARRCWTRTLLLLHQIRELDKGSRFGARAYQRVLEQVPPRRALAPRAWSALLGVGPRITEALRRGCRGVSPAELEQALSVEEWLQVPFVGLRSALRLVREHGARPGGGTDPALLTQQQLKGLRLFLEAGGWSPFAREEARAHLRVLRAAAREAGVRRFAAAGSYRRRCSGAVEDLDVVVAPLSSQAAFLRALRARGYLREVLAGGRQKVLAVCRLSDAAPPRRVDLQFTSGAAFPFALLYMTGDRFFTLELRRRARELGRVLSEHGLSPPGGGVPDTSSGRDGERGIFRALGIPYVPPTKRCTFSRLA